MSSALLTTPKGQVTIRPAEPDDAADLLQLRLEALASHPEAFAADYASTATETVDFWRHRIATTIADKRGVTSIAVAENEFIGMTGLIAGNWPKTRHSGTIWGVYVKPAWRGCGVADALLDACVAWAHSQGLAAVKLGVITSNTSAIHCYTRCGFTVYGLEPRVIYYNNVFYDELLMARLI